MEKDNEVKGEGNSYTTFFRQNDPRIGRWLSIDPKVTAFESSYISMGNSPLCLNDVLGDTVKFQSDRASKLYNSAKTMTNNKILAANNKIEKLQGKIDKLEAKTNPNTYKINNLKNKKTDQQNTVNLYKGILGELDDLEKSTIVFRIRFGEADFHKSTSGGPEAGGNFGYNLITKEYDVNVKEASFDPLTGVTLGWTNIQKLMHELKHGYQLINHQISLFGNGGGTAYDITDEYEAHERQNLYSDSFNNKITDVIKHVNTYYPKLYQSKPNAINVVPANMASNENYY
jgi:hypothetical protein